MVPRINDHAQDGDMWEEDRLVTPRPNIKKHLNWDELELGIRDERRKLKFKFAALGFITACVATACAIAAYSIAWSSWAKSEEWKSYERSRELQPQGIYQPIEEHVLYIGVLSSPSNFKQRMLARRTWVDDAHKEFKGRVKVEFLVGQVPLQGDQVPVQVVATDDERRLESRLQHEATLHNDISRIPVAESLLYETDKVLWALANGASWKARFVMKATDAEQVAVRKTLTALQKRTPIAPPVYFGKVWTSNTVPEGDGSTSWLFSGCYGISGDLAQQISVAHLDHSVGFPMFGTSSADVNVSKWVNFEDALRRRNDILPVKHIWMPKLCEPTSDGKIDADAEASELSSLDT